MSIFDILGPVMVGPSSSHTAGAVRIGYISRQLINDSIVKADIYLHGSFYSTGKGHGTDRALIAGLLGMKPDDERIPYSFEEAHKAGMQYTFNRIDLRDAHPNSVLLKLESKNNITLEIVASSIGGGRIKICKIDGIDVNFSGDSPTLIVHNIDEPGHVTGVTSMIAKNCVNISGMQLYRIRRGGNAVMVIECDEEIPKESIEWLKNIDGIIKVTYLSKEEDHNDN